MTDWEMATVRRRMKEKIQQVDRVRQTEKWQWRGHECRREGSRWTESNRLGNGNGQVGGRTASGRSGKPTGK